MRKIMTFALASSAVVAVACGKDKAPTTASMSADLKRDLQLASTTQGMAINPDEVSPTSKPQVALRAKKAPEGLKVIRSEKPTVKASATPVQAAEIKTDIPQVQVMASAPAPTESPTPDAPPLARPAPVPATQYPATGNEPGPYDGHRPGTRTGGSGGIWGGIFGGGAGDDDHCEPRPMPRGRPVGGDIYGTGRPGTVMGRGPIVPITRPRGR